MSSVLKLTREFNIQYRAHIGSLIYILSKRVKLGFAVQKLAKYSANPGNVHFEELVHLLRYIRDSKTLVLKYYVDTNDEPVTDLLRQASIKTEKYLITFSDSSRQYFPDTGRSTGAYIFFYQDGPIDHGIHVPGPVEQSIAESEYNVACNAGMDLSEWN